jgi:hypothetical protein
VADALLNDNWISDVVHDLSPALMAQYIMLWILVDAVPFDREETADGEIIWRMTANGAYLIGCGKGSFLFIDFLALDGQSVLQIGMLLQLLQPFPDAREPV